MRGKLEKMKEKPKMSEIGHWQ